MPVSGLTTGESITAAQFNELVALYNAYWQGDNTVVFDSNHASDLTRRKGWGQPTVAPTVSLGTIITAEHTNYLISQINAGLWHMLENVSDLTIHRAPSAAIAATLYTELETLYDTKFSVNKLVCHPTAKSVTTNVVSVTNSSSSTWTNDLYCENTFTFDNYNEARHFFNSGGELLVDMSASSGGTNAPSQMWSDFFDDMGIVRIGAEKTTNDGDGDVQGAFNSLNGDRGFYNINQSTANYVIIYDVAADARTDENGDPISGFSDYAQRRFRILLKGEDLSPIFKVHLKIELIEDNPADNVPYDAPIDTNIIAELGYAQPLDTPTNAESSVNDRFSPATGINYIFAEREFPGIQSVVGWTATDITP